MVQPPVHPTAALNAADALVEQARSLHVQGQLAQALDDYRQALALNANHFEALQLAATACLQLGDAPHALEYCDRALRQRPELFFLIGHKATALQQLGRLDEAITEFDRAIRLNPDYRDGFNNRGLCFMASARWALALEDFERALSLKPNAADALMNRGIALSKLKRLPHAQESFEAVIRLYPTMPEPYNNLGNLLLENGEAAQAVELFNHALTLRQPFPEAWINLGNAYRQLGKPAEALQAYEQALRWAPALASAWRAVGLAHKDLYRFEDAVTAFTHALTLDPSDADTLSNRGNAFLELGAPTKALADFQQACSQNPTHAPLWVNCGNAYEALGQLDEAHRCHSQALQLDGDFIEAYSNRGHVELERQNLSAALADFDSALQRQADFGDARWNRALAWLQLGRLAEGFADYEWRWNTERGAGRRFKRHFSQPLWLGQEPLAGQTILVYAEQGLGDTVQFARYVPRLEAMGARVVFEVQRPLVPLMTHHLIGSKALVLAKGQDLPAFDWQVPIVSLPLAFKTQLHSIPAGVPYLSVDAQLGARWRAWLDGVDAARSFRIAIAWKGNTRGRVDRRAFELKHFKAIAQMSGVTLISVQKNEGSEELTDPHLGFTVHSPPEPFDELPFLDTAALMREVDLVITSDTSLTHVAGALGVAALLPLRFASEWRWLMERTDSPWYLHHELIRQPTLGDWDTVFEQIAQNVKRRVEAQRSTR